MHTTPPTHFRRIRATTHGFAALSSLYLLLPILPPNLSLPGLGAAFIFATTAETRLRPRHTNLGTWALILHIIFALTLAAAQLVTQLVAPSHPTPTHLFASSAVAAAAFWWSSILSDLIDRHHDSHLPRQTLGSFGLAFGPIYAELSLIAILWSLGATASFHLLLAVLTYAAFRIPIDSLLFEAFQPAPTDTPATP